MDYTIRIGGMAGQGLLSIGTVLAKILACAGFHVFRHQDYMSRVRGGHNFYQIRFADCPIAASRANVDVLLALDKDTIECHSQDLSAGGKILCDATAARVKFSAAHFLDIPFARIAEALGVLIRSWSIPCLSGQFWLCSDLRPRYLQQPSRLRCTRKARE